MPGLRARVAPRVARDERPRRLRHGDGVGRAHAPLPRAPRRRAANLRSERFVFLSEVDEAIRRWRRRAPRLDDAVPRRAPPAQAGDSLSSSGSIRSRSGRSRRAASALEKRLFLVQGEDTRRGALPRDGRSPAAHRCVRRVSATTTRSGTRTRARRDRPRWTPHRDRLRRRTTGCRSFASTTRAPRVERGGRLVSRTFEYHGGAGARARLPGGPLAAACTPRGGAPRPVARRSWPSTLGERRIDAAAADALERTELERAQRRRTRIPSPPAFPSPRISSSSARATISRLNAAKPPTTTRCPGRPSHRRRRLPLVHATGARHDDLAPRAARRPRPARRGARASSAASSRTSTGGSCRTASPTRESGRSTTRWTGRSGLFQAVHAYERAGGDGRFLRDIFPAVREILDAHVRGTHHGIRVDPDDGLLVAGDAGTQLTWMDAKVGDWVVTPRHGKPVEVNALWYDALRLAERWADGLGHRAGGGRATRGRRSASPRRSTRLLDRRARTPRRRRPPGRRGPPPPAEPAPRGVAPVPAARRCPAARGRVGGRARAPHAVRAAHARAPATRSTSRATGAARASATAPTTRVRYGPGSSGPFVRARLAAFGHTPENVARCRAIRRRARVAPRGCVPWAGVRDASRRSRRSGRSARPRRRGASRRPSSSSSATSRSGGEAVDARLHWPEYLGEAALLGAFMLSRACSACCSIHPASPPSARLAIRSPGARCLGLAMGATAIAIIYSPWASGRVPTSTRRSRSPSSGSER